MVRQFSGLFWVREPTKVIYYGEECICPYGAVAPLHSVNLHTTCLDTVARTELTQTFWNGECGEIEAKLADFSIESEY